LKKVISKADIRGDLQREMDRFLRGGGKVDEIPQGCSGKNPGDAPIFLNGRLFVEPKAERTLVPEVVAAIEARRKKKPSTSLMRKGSRNPSTKRKIIYDDFGEPLRRVWIEE